VNSPVDDVTVQVTLSEVRPDDTETLLQSGHLRLGHRAGTVLPDGRIERDYSAEAFAPVPVDQWVRADVEIPSFAHPIRAGSRLRMTVSTPGRSHGTWEFGAPVYDGPPTFQLGRGGAQASGLSLSTLDSVTVPPGLPLAAGLHLQALGAHGQRDRVAGPAGVGPRLALPAHGARPWVARRNHHGSPLGMSLG
jgi:hypothetical protein